MTANFGIVNGVTRPPSVDPVGTAGVFLRVGQLTQPPVASLANQAQVLERAFYVPMLIQNACLLDQIAINVQAGGSTGSTMRLGIYTDAEGYPDALIVDGGTVATVSPTTGVVAVNLPNVPVPAGWIWLAAAAQGGTAPTLRGGIFATPRANGLGGPISTSISTNLQSALNGVPGAFPLTANIGSSPIGTGGPHIAIRRSR